jgi:hypothetical protein
MKAVRKHTDNPWVILYIQRWLKAPFQMPDGTVKERLKGTPQGGWVDRILCPGRDAQHFQEPGRLDAEEAAHVHLEAVEASADKVPRATCTRIA